MRARYCCLLPIPTASLGGVALATANDRGLLASSPWWQVLASQQMHWSLALNTTGDIRRYKRSSSVGLEPVIPLSSFPATALGLESALRTGVAPLH
jgi:hypothetical protein